AYGDSWEGSAASGGRWGTPFGGHRTSARKVGTSLRKVRHPIWWAPNLCAEGRQPFLGARGPHCRRWGTLFDGVVTPFDGVTTSLRKVRTSLGQSGASTGTRKMKAPGRPGRFSPFPLYTRTGNAQAPQPPRQIGGRVPPARDRPSGRLWLFCA